MLKIIISVIFATLLLLCQANPYNLTIYETTTLPLLTAQSIIDHKQLISTSPYYQKLIFLLVYSNTTAIKLIRANLTTTYTALQSLNINVVASQNSSVQKLRPSLYLLNSQLIVNFKLESNITANTYGGAQARFTIMNFSVNSVHYDSYYYDCQYFPQYDLFYFISERGQQGIFANASILHQNLIASDTTTINPLTNVVTEIQGVYIFKSPNDSYIVTVNAIQNIMKITKVDYLLGISPSFNSKKVISLNHTIFQSLCYYRQDMIYLHFSDGTVEIYDLVTGYLIVTLSTTIQFSHNCFYDVGINSIVMVYQNTTGLLFSPFVTNSYPIQSYFLSGFRNFQESGLNYSVHGSKIINRYTSKSCSLGYYYNFALFQCFPCSSGCLTCNSSLICFQCDQIHTLNNQICCDSPSYYVDIVNLTKTCLICSTNCKTCSNFTICLSCNTGYQLNSSLCLLIVITPNLTESTVTPTALLIDSLISNKAVLFINSLPGSRTILKPILSCLITLDELYLFQFHQRNYGPTLQKLFLTIQSLQNAKWSSYDDYVINPLLSMINANQEDVVKFLNIKANYSSPYFIAVQGNGQEFPVNAWSFITTTGLTSLALFIILRLIFSLLYRFKISKVFRPYSFWGYIFLMLLQGNLQILVFFLFSNLHLSFSQHFSDKFYTLINYTFLFALTIFASCYYILIYVQYRELAKYFGQNAMFSQSILIFWSIDGGLKQFWTGVINNLYRKQADFNIQLSILLVIEGLCFFNFCYFLANRWFINKIKVVPISVISIFKISLLFTLLLKCNFDTNGQNIFEPIIVVLVSSYLYIIYISISINFIIFIKEVYFMVVHLISKIPEAEHLSKSNIDQSCCFEKSLKDQKSKVSIYGYESVRQNTLTLHPNNNRHIITVSNDQLITPKQYQERQYSAHTRKDHGLQTIITFKDSKAESNVNISQLQITKTDQGKLNVPPIYQQITKQVTLKVGKHNQQIMKFNTSNRLKSIKNDNFVSKNQLQIWKREKEREPSIVSNIKMSNSSIPGIKIILSQKNQK